MFTLKSHRFFLASLLWICNATITKAETRNVPQDHPTIQSAIDAASAGDIVLVSAGTYQERIRLKPAITLKSVGDDTMEKIGFRRAEATIIDGNFEAAVGPGVTMAEDSTLDGFTVTGVGAYDEQLWKKHFATHGEQQSHEHIGAAGTPGIAVSGATRCTVANNIVHHIGYTGIAITGAEGQQVSPLILGNIAYRNMGGGIGSMQGSTATIIANICFENFYAGIGHNNASPLVIDNVCYGNIRAGIGISEGSCPLVRGNKCYQNRRAGIGIRSGEETQPIVEHNECYQNEMAGIGNRDNARPIIRHNRCYKNKMAGIGSRDGAQALIEHNECFENEMAGIGSRLGAAPVIRNNRCYRNEMAGIGARENSRPVIEGNECFENKMAGIGTQTEAEAVIRNNRCYQNEMAGIGSRLGARPIIEANDCYENKMAGIGSREGAAPIIRGNRSYQNEMAGIGSRLGARPVIVENESRENQMAGIGVRSDAVAIILGNKCLENRLVAIGLPDGASGLIVGNELKRTEGGAPPLVAVKGGAVALLLDNQISGGGVAGVLVEGTACLLGNQFHGKGQGQGSAIWVWDKSNVVASDNTFEGYRNALNASGSSVTASGNRVTRFEGPSLIVRKPTEPPRVFGNTAISDNPKDSAALVDGDTALEINNKLVKSGEGDNALIAPHKQWSVIAGQAEPVDWHQYLAALAGEVSDDTWKLVATFDGKKINYRLYNRQDDPNSQHDLSAELEQITFRLRGLLERQEAAKYKSALMSEKPAAQK